MRRVAAMVALLFLTAACTQSRTREVSPPTIRLQPAPVSASPKSDASEQAPDAISPGILGTGIFERDVSRGCVHGGYGPGDFLEPLGTLARSDALAPGATTVEVSPVKPKADSADASVFAIRIPVGNDSYRDRLLFQVDARCFPIDPSPAGDSRHSPTAAEAKSALGVHGGEQPQVRSSSDQRSETSGGLATSRLASR